MHLTTNPRQFCFKQAAKWKCQISVDGKSKKNHGYFTNEDQVGAAAAAYDNTLNELMKARKTNTSASTSTCADCRNANTFKAYKFVPPLGNVAVGWYVRVFWPDNNKFYQGQVVSCRCSGNTRRPREKNGDV